MSALPVPTRPCPWCSSTSFARLKQASVELYVGGSHSGASCPEFVLLMCLGCGCTSWFTDPKGAWDYFGKRAERVDVPPQVPYR